MRRIFSLFPLNMRRIICINDFWNSYKTPKSYSAYSPQCCYFIPADDISTFAHSIFTIQFITFAILAFKNETFT